METTRVFVRGLPPTLTSDKGQEALKKHFSAGGRQVTDVKIIPHRRIGFVGFKTAEEANTAVNYFNRSFLKASRLSVSLAKPVDDPSLQKPTFDHGKLPTASQAPQAAVAKPDLKDNEKKRKRNEVDEADPKLAEYLKTFQATKSAANEVSEMLNPAVVEEQEKLLKEDESDDEYESIPARPEKRQMTEVSRDPTKVASGVTQSTPLPVEKAETLGESKETESNPQPESEVTTTSVPAATDDDWLRSRTNRLLDLVDDDEVLQRPPPQPRNEDQVGEAGDQSVVVMADGQDKPALGQSAQEMDTTADEPPKPMREEEVDAAVATIRKTARLFVRNLAFVSGKELEAQETDLRKHFEQYGETQEVHIAVTAAGMSKGYAFISFTNADSAAAAFQSSGPGSTFQGRLLHVLPASAQRDEALDEYQLSKLPLAKQRVIRKKAEASKTFNWNSLYMSQDAVNSSVASRLGISKADLLDVHDSSAAVKQAVAETSVINETKDYFALNGVDLDAFKSQKKGDDCILVKNFPHGTTTQEIRELMEQHGTVLQVLMPPSGTIAIVQFAQPAQGKTAFSRLAYCRFKDTVLFLEKGPKGLFRNDGSQAAQVAIDRPTTASQKLSATDLFEDKDAEEETGATSLFAKNLSFNTTKERLAEAFEPLEGFRGCTVKTKADPKKPGQVLSLGYGFVAFSSKAAATAALSSMDGFVLDGHALSMKLSTKGYDAAEERRREDKAKKSAGQRTKLIVKNLGFEVSKKDLRSLFSNYGQLRSCRIPQNMGGKSRGFGFVDFKTSREAENALNAMKDTHLLGRRLVIDWAEADFDDPEEQIKAMEAKVRGQTEKVQRAQLTNRTRKRVQIGDNDNELDA